MTLSMHAGVRDGVRVKQIYSCMHHHHVKSNGVNPLNANLMTVMNDYMVQGQSRGRLMA